jgi:16S rRNA (cytosine1402-N4)-methyltransferase
VHLPVLFNQVIAALAVRPDACYIDCTLGGGGHASGIIEASGPHGRLLGLDRDPDALAGAAQRFEAYGDRVVLVNSNFAEIGSAAREAQFTRVDGILFDLGLSSMQLADQKRGFSIQNDGPLDMRFDPSHGVNAADIVNHWPEREIADVIFRYGEEPRARAIARAIVRRRPLRTTGELAAAVASAVHSRGRLHPATRTFQAIRIAVNDELAMIEEALPQTLDLLQTDGRLAVISFHSLEDRIVKNFMREQQQSEKLRVLTKKPLSATADEIKANPRSRSGKLRVAVRL